MSVEIKRRVREKIIDPLTTPENELIYGAWTTSYHSFWSIASKEVVEVVDNQLDKINIASEYVPYVLYPYLGARIAAGAFFMIHGAYRLRDNRTYYKVAANMAYENLTEVPRRLTSVLNIDKR